MKIYTFIKTSILLNLLNWYRRNFDLDVDEVISPLDETINEISRRLISDMDDRKEMCRRHYFSQDAFACTECGWGSRGIIQENIK
jgi:hypothetical protein